jgi:hypothetical protein
LWSIPPETPKQFWHQTKKKQLSINDMHKKAPKPERMDKVRPNSGAGYCNLRCS